MIINDGPLIASRFVENLGLTEESEYDQWVFTEQDGTTQIGGYASYYTNLSYVTVKVRKSSDKMNLSMTKKKKTKNKKKTT